MLKEKEHMIEILNKEKSYYKKKLDMMVKSQNDFEEMQKRLEEACNLITSLKQENENLKSSNKNLIEKKATHSVVDLGNKLKIQSSLLESQAQ